MNKVMDCPEPFPGFNDLHKRLFLQPTPPPVTITEHPPGIGVKPVCPPHKSSTVSDQESVKHDDGKQSLTQIFYWLDMDWLLGVCSVLSFGAKKYEKDNWKKGFEPNRVLDGALRHIQAHVNGEFFDSESKLPHLLHSACGLMFAYFHSKKKGFYDQ